VSALAVVAVTAAHGQATSDLAAQLTADFLPLQSALVDRGPLQDAVYSREELQSLISYSQSRVIQAYQRDIRSFEAASLREPRKFGDPPLAFSTFASVDQAYKLTRVLAGKDLSEDNLAPLTRAITAIITSAITSRKSGASIRDSTALRDSSQQTYDALRNIGVNNRDLRIVIDAFLRGAQTLSQPAPVTIFK
jgi:hypothetical protein